MATTMESLLQHIDQVTEPQRSAVRLLYLESLTLREAADRIGASKETVYQWVLEGMEQLKTSP